MSIAERIRADVVFAARMAAILARVLPLARDPSRTLPPLVETMAARHGERRLFVSARESLTVGQYNALANRIARWALANGIGKGDTVCLLMPNRPIFPAIWLGIARAGGATALLNTNLAGRALAHSINIVAPRHIIVAAELADAFASAAPLVRGAPGLWWHGEGGGGGQRIDLAAAALDDGPLDPAVRPALTHEDRCLYIYTSGTTGMPKAANINHYRVMAAMVAFATAMGASSRDRMYDCLPLYHTVGGVIALGAGLIGGGTVFIAERFSAHQFWDDVVDNGCTLFQYIGELCRYLVNAPPHPKERQSRIRLACGNGLRPDVWEAFRSRFGIGEIREFYAATEGNAVMFNLDGRPGAVGRCPRGLRAMFPLINVRLDDGEESHAAVARGADGLAVPCAPGEVGELISEIVFDPMKPGQRFDGYADRAATEAKILRDVFRPGDMWFRSADLVRRDSRGYFFFVDRIGDTFRWKGENVSASEVAEIIDAGGFVKEAAAFGVAVPGCDGKAGMVAVVPGADFSIAALWRLVHARLPSYARPLFVRLQAEIDATSTFKQRKLTLQREGFDPKACGSDPLYFDPPNGDGYVPLDGALHDRIRAGALRL